MHRVTPNKRLGNDKGPESRGFKKSAEIGHGSSTPPWLHRRTIKQVFWELSYPWREELPNSDNFLNPRLSSLLSFPEKRQNPVLPFFVFGSSFFLLRGMPFFVATQKWLFSGPQVTFGVAFKVTWGGGNPRKSRLNLVTFELLLTLRGLGGFRGATCCLIRCAKGIFAEGILEGTRVSLFWWQSALEVPVCKPERVCWSKATSQQTCTDLCDWGSGALSHRKRENPAKIPLAKIPLIMGKHYPSPNGKPSATSSRKFGQKLSHHVMPKVLVLKV